MPRLPLVAAVAAIIAVCATPAPAGAQVERPEDPGGFRNVLSVGQGETVDITEFGAFTATGEPPASFTNQLPAYRDLLYAAPGLREQDLATHFKPARFGVAPEEIASTEQPVPGLTVIRDKTYGVPHVYGATRALTMFGMGYVSAQDRLFMMDVLRHYGRGRLSELAGPGRGDELVEDDAEQFMATGYSEQELTRQVEGLPERYGAEGAQARQDLHDYAAGVNHFIAEARRDPSKMPAEYALLSTAPRDWTPTDSVATASLIGGIFGRGGGAEHVAGEVYSALAKRMGARRARRAFRDLRQAEDPEAPVTVRRRFPFDRPGRRSVQAVALPDPGSVRAWNPVRSGSGVEPQARTGAGRRLASNALLVGRKASPTGRPLAVMGPQVAWYSPQILMEVDVHGPGIDARGASFPGVSLVVLVGRGRDFAWSATTATTDNVDVFAEELCEPDGTRPTTESTHYRYRGRCIPMEVRRQEVQTRTSAGSREAPRRIVMELRRTVHGNVQATGTVAGKPVAFAEARSTFLHELDSLIAFSRLNSNRVTDPRSFQRAMSFVNFAFNWFYVDDRNIAFLQSGWYPKRARGVDLDFPAWGTGAWDWRGFDPRTHSSRRLGFARLPKGANPRQNYIVNWNNKQAPGWRAADDNWSYSAAHRSERLEDPLRRDLRRDGEVTLTRLVQIMELGATQDVRGLQVYPLLRRVIGRGPTGDARVDDLLRRLDAWVRDGSHRRDLDKDDVFEHSAAVALMDAWEPRYVRAIFEPVTGDLAFERATDINPVIDTPPYNEGSGFGTGWYGQVGKDLRRLLGRRVRAPLSRGYCGRGSRARCRAVLISTLRGAADRVAQEQGSASADDWRVPTTCEPLRTGDDLPKRCDQIEFETVGAVDLPPIPWQDRPTFQQVVEVGNRDVG